MRTPRFFPRLVALMSQVEMRVMHTLQFMRHTTEKMGHENDDANDDIQCCQNNTTRGRMADRVDAQEQ